MPAGQWAETEGLIPASLHLLYWSGLAAPATPAWAPTITMWFSKYNDNICKILKAKPQVFLHISKGLQKKKKRKKYFVKYFFQLSG